MKILEGFLVVLLLVALQAWCTLWAYAALRVVGTLPLEDEWQRAVGVAAALAGVAFGLWSAYRLRRRR